VTVAPQKAETGKPHRDHRFLTPRCTGIMPRSRFLSSSSRETTVFRHALCGPTKRCFWPDGLRLAKAAAMPTAPNGRWSRTIGLHTPAHPVWAGAVVQGIGLLTMAIDKREQTGRSAGAWTSRLRMEKRTVPESTLAGPFRCVGRCKPTRATIGIDGTLLGASASAWRKSRSLCAPRPTIVPVG
jgi:hypothetical protein